MNQLDPWESLIPRFIRYARWHLLSLFWELVQKRYLDAAHGTEVKIVKEATRIGGDRGAYYYHKVEQSAKDEDATTECQVSKPPSWPSGRRRGRQGRTAAAATEATTPKGWRPCIKFGHFEQTKTWLGSFHFATTYFDKFQFHTATSCEIGISYLGLSLASSLLNFHPKY